jgi:hypothetical protein
VGAPPDPAPKSTVHIPIRIRFGAGTLDLDRAGPKLEDAVSKQVGRALDVVGDRPIGTDTQMKVTFTGKPVSKEQQQVFEDAAAKHIINAVHKAKQQRPTPSAKATATPSETKKQLTWTVRVVPNVKDWHVFSKFGDQEFYNALYAELHQRFGDAAGWPATYGILFRLGNGLQLRVVSDRLYIAAMPITTPNFLQKGGDTSASLDPKGHEFTLDLEPGGQDTYYELAFKDARNQIGKRDYKGKVISTATVTAPDQDLDDKAEKAAREYMAGWETKIGGYYWLSAGNKRMRLLPIVREEAAALSGKSPIPVVSLTDLVADEDLAELDELDADGLGQSKLPVDDGGGGGGGKDGSGGQADEGDGSGDQGDGGGDGDFIGSDVRAAPPEGMKSGHGIVNAPTYKEDAPIFPEVPSDPNAKVVDITCKPYDGEPSVDELGSAGQTMKQLITEIAARLDMPPCAYPANFCITASKMLNVRASQVHERYHAGDKGFFQEIVVGGVDSSGQFEFKPLPSIAVQYLRHIGATVPRIRNLIELVFEHSAKKIEYAAWAAHWFEHVMDEAVKACATIFMYANQIVMSQLLNSSLDAVQQRQARIGEYIKVFGVLVRTQGADLVETIMLRDALKKFIDIAGDRHGQDAYETVRLRLLLNKAVTNDPHYDEYELLAKNGTDPDLMLKLADKSQYVFKRASTEAQPQGVGQIVEVDNHWLIRGSDGKLYALDALEKTISIGQQMLSSIDPIISQLMHRFVSAIRPLAEDPTKIPDFVTGLLKEMASTNENVARKNLGSIEYAFEHGQIHDVSYDEKDSAALRTPTIPGGRFVLTGIHAMAHELVGTSFGNDAFYRTAVDSLLGHEQGWKELKGDLVVFGGVVLSVICPPLGAAFGLIAGIAMGIQDYRHAKEQEEIYGALINPDQVLDYAQIQVDLFVAKLSIALSFLAVIPEGISAVKGVTAASERVLAKELQTGVKTIAKELIVTQLAKLEEVCAKNLLLEFAKEMVSQTVQQKIIEKLLTPVIESEIDRLEKELQAEGAI